MSSAALDQTTSTSTAQFCCGTECAQMPAAAMPVPGRAEAWTCFLSARLPECWHPETPLYALVVSLALMLALIRALGTAQIAGKPKQLRK